MRTEFITYIILYLLSTRLKYNIEYRRLFSQGRYQKHIIYLTYNTF